MNKEKKRKLILKVYMQIKDKCCNNCLGCNQQELKYFKEKENCKNFVYCGKDKEGGKK